MYVNFLNNEENLARMNLLILVAVAVAGVGQLVSSLWSPQSL